MPAKAKPPAKAKLPARPVPTITVTLNGQPRALAVTDPDQPLLYVLRNDLGLTGTKVGCGKGECGACTVLLDGEPVRACQIPVQAAAGKAITTIEGLGTPEAPHPVQAAFIAEQASQCGYCSSGMVVEAAALLARDQRPGLDDVKQALAGHLCRCGSHRRILRAVLRASGSDRP